MPSDAADEVDTINDDKVEGGKVKRASVSSALVVGRRHGGGVIMRTKKGKTGASFVDANDERMATVRAGTHDADGNYAPSLDLLGGKQDRNEDGGGIGIAGGVQSAEIKAKGRARLDTAHVELKNPSGNWFRLAVSSDGQIVLTPATVMAKPGRAPPMPRPLLQSRPGIVQGICDLPFITQGSYPPSLRLDTTLQGNVDSAMIDYFPITRLDFETFGTIQASLNQLQLSTEITGSIFSSPQIVATTTIDGQIAINVVSAGSANWWNFTGMRSARTNGRRSGISYWGASNSTLTTNLQKYEQQVAYCDAWNGGQPDSADETMEMITGGDNSTDNNTITAGSALDWSGGSSHWRAGWNNLPSGTIAIWAANFISRDRRTDGGDGQIWIDIKNGLFDRAFVNMGRRIKKNFDTPSLNPRGHLPSRLMIRLNHENNQSNYYRVLVAQKANYKAAMEKAIAKIREGLGDYGTLVKFFHAPANGSEGIDLGDYLTWCPDNVDALSVSWHPRNGVTDADSLTAYNNGTDSAIAYSLAEVLAASVSTGKPLIFPEWSPRFEATVGCPVADICMDSFDAFLTANASRIICDCVYHPNTLIKTAYAGPGSGGGAAWSRSVDIYKTKWSGSKAPPP